MRENKKINCIRYALAAVSCAGTLLLGGCSDTGEGTWKQEYETCMAAMEQGISERGMAGRQEHEQDTSKQKAWDRVMELWQDSLSAFGECVETCIGNRSGEMDGEEDIYRTATLLMAAMCEEHGGSYEFAYEHGEDTEKIREDFRTVIEGENPIDESRDSLHEDFGIYYYADALITRMAAEAWEEEFYHCLDIAGNEVKQSGAADKEQILELLETYEDFFEVWVDNERAYRWQEYYNDVGTENEERYVWMELGREGLSIWQAESRAEVFRIGTLLLADGLEKSGGSYGFVYDDEARRQELTDLLGVCPEMDDGTWKQEYAICMAAMERGISEYTSISSMPYEYLQGSDKEETDRSKELWQDSLSAFDECMAVCIRNQTGGTDGEEDICRMAVLLMKTLCESRNGHYTLAHGHGEDPDKAQEDFEAVINGENPIDEAIKLFYEEFDSYFQEFIISAMAAEAWQEEFHHCLDTAGDRVRQSDAADQGQILEVLEAWEDFFEAWADNEEAYEQIESGTGMNIFIAESRAEVFRIGTLLLADGLEGSGYSYEFIYDSGADMQHLIENYPE